MTWLKLSLRVVQAAALIYIGYSLQTPFRGIEVAAGVAFTGVPFLVDTVLERRSRRDDLEHRVRGAMSAFDLSSESHAIVYVRRGWTVYRLSRGKLYRNPKRLRALTREVTPNSGRGYQPNVPPKTTTGAVGVAYSERKVVAGWFPDRPALDAFSRELHMTEEDVAAQSDKAAIYTVPIRTQDYPIGAIYVVSQRIGDFDNATIDKFDPTRAMRAFRRTLEQIAADLAVRR